MQTYNWPYKNELDITETLSCDVLVLGGGLAGCYAAIAAARRGQSVILVEKGATARRRKLNLVWCTKIRYSNTFAAFTLAF